MFTLRRILQQLSLLVTEHDGTWRYAEVFADAEGALVYLRRQSAIACQIVQQVQQSMRGAGSAGLEELANRGGIARPRVGRGKGIAKLRQNETRTLLVHVIEACVGDPSIERGTPGEIVLQDRVIEWVRGPGRVGEPPVATCRLDG